MEKNWTSQALTFCRDLSKEQLRQLPFRKAIFPETDNRDLIRQAHCYQKLKDKLPSWWQRGDLIFSDTRVIEQAGSEWTSAWKIHQFGDFEGHWVDVSAGLGVDTWAMAGKAASRTLLEPDPDRAFCLEHNLQRLLQAESRVQVQPFHPAVFDGLPEHHPIRVYADPDRRQADGVRIPDWHQTEPSVAELHREARARGYSLLVKLSPLDDPLAIAAELPGVRAIWVLSVHQEVKEVLMLWEANVPVAEPEMAVVDIRKDGTWREVPVPHRADKPRVGIPALGHFLLDPWPGLRKNQWASRLAAASDWLQISSEAQLYTATTMPVAFPGRVFRIEGIFDGLKAFLRENRQKEWHVVSRNFPVSAEEISRKNKWVERGEDYVFCYRDLEGKAVVLACRRLEKEG